MILYNKYFRLHGHIADLLVPSKTNMEELLQMCTFPKRSGRLSLYYHHHGTRGVLQVHDHDHFISSSSLQCSGRRCRSPHSPENGWREWGKYYETITTRIISHNMIIHNLTSKSMVTDVKVPCLTKRRSVTLKLSGLTKLVTNWTTKVEKR